MKALSSYDPRKLEFLIKYPAFLLLMVGVLLGFKTAESFIIFFVGLFMLYISLEIRRRRFLGAKS